MKAYPCDASVKRMPNPRASKPLAVPAPPEPPFDIAQVLEPALLATLQDPTTPSEELERIYQAELDDSDDNDQPQDQKNHHTAVWVLLAQNPNSPVSTLSGILSFAHMEPIAAEAMALNPGLPLAQLAEPLPWSFWSGLNEYLERMLTPVLTKRLLKSKGVWEWIEPLWPEEAIHAKHEAHGAILSPFTRYPGQDVVRQLRRYAYADHDIAFRYLRLIRLLRAKKKVPVQTTWESWL